LSLIRSLTEYGAVCWDPYRQNQMDTLEHVQRRAEKFVRMGGGHGDDRDGNHQKVGVGKRGLELCLRRI
jgi:hypothetical protein